MPLNKSDIVDTVSKQLGTSKKRSLRVTACIFEAIKQGLASGDEVRIAGFGKFYIQHRKSRKGRNPSTGEITLRGPGRSIAFKCFKKLQERINPLEILDLSEPCRVPEIPDEKRTRPRYEHLRGGTAVVRVAGFPVCHFKIKDISENGTGFLVERDSTILRNLRVGQEIEIRLPAWPGRSESIFQKAQVVHITHEFQYSGYFILGVRILNQFLATK